MNTDNNKYKIDFNNKKEITINNETITVYRIIAIKDFSDVKTGDVGGYVGDYHNLSQYGDCWIYNDAIVCEYGKVCDHATIRNNAMIFGDAVIKGNSCVKCNAQVFEKACISNNVCISEQSKIYGCAKVTENACIAGESRVYDKAFIKSNACINAHSEIFGRAIISGNSLVTGNAKVYCGATITGNAVMDYNAVAKDNAYVGGVTYLLSDAVISQQQRVLEGVVEVDLSKNLKESIRCQTGLGVFDNKVIAYKQVNKDLSSFYDKNFVYKIGEIVEKDFCDYSSKSHSTELYFSNMVHWNKQDNIKNSTFLMAEIQLEDIITVQEGKICCRKAKILGRYDIE